MSRKNKVATTCTHRSFEGVKLGPYPLYFCTIAVNFLFVYSTPTQKTVEVNDWAAAASAQHNTTLIIRKMSSGVWTFNPS